MALLIHAGAILLTALLCWGVLDGMSQASPARWLGRASAWSGVIGGGVYGLGCFDSGLLPGFNWTSLLIVVVGGLACLMAWRLFHAK